MRIQKDDAVASTDVWQTFGLIVAFNRATGRSLD